MSTLAVVGEIVGGIVGIVGEIVGEIVGGILSSDTVDRLGRVVIDMVYSVILVRLYTVGHANQI